jgi:hypothetical protein
MRGPTCIQLWASLTPSSLKAFADNLTVLTSTTERQMEQVDRLTAQNNMLVGELGKLQAVSDELKGTNRALESTRRAANSGGPCRGSHRTPWHPVEDPLDPLQMGKVP